VWGELQSPEALVSQFPDQLEKDQKRNTQALYKHNMVLSGSEDAYYETTTKYHGVLNSPIFH